MIKSIHTTLCVALLLVAANLVLGQTAPTETAVNEAVRRQADTIVLRERLIEAQRATVEQDLPLAARKYEDAYVLVQRIGPSADAEAAQTVAGLTAVRLQLAKAAQGHRDYKEADVQISRVLRISPTNEEALELKKKNDMLLAGQAGHVPSEETLDMVPGIMQEKVDAGTLVQDGKLLYELGKYDEAEARLKQALKVDPPNRGAQYYLDLVREARYGGASTARENYSRDAQVKVEQAWEMSVKRDQLPVPNPYPPSDIVYTGKGRQVIVSKLDRIKMDAVLFDGLPLGEVIRILNEESKKRDPDKRGINFLINPNEESTFSAAPVATAFDPITGLPIAPPPGEEEAADLSGVLIKINPPLTDVRLADVLDAVVKVAEQPIKYSIEDYAVVFSLRGFEPERLYTRTYKVDPNTFWQGLESVGGFAFGDIEVGSQGGGGGGGRGGGRGGSGSGDSSVISVPRVNVGGAISGGGGGRGGGGNQSQQSGSGLRFITSTNTMEQLQSSVRQFFITMGVNLTPPKTIFFNDRSGTLWARATLQELDIIESAVQVLNVSPPQVNIKAKFADIGQRDSKAIGFDWFLGNFLMGSNGEVVGSGGTQPSLIGQPLQGHPTFPGTSSATTIPSSPGDQLITSGLGNALNAPAVATFTGILTDPQFRVVIRALDQREGVDLLSAPEVTTISGRQAQIQVIDIESIVTGLDLNQTATGGSSTGGVNQNNTGGGAVASTLNYNVQALPFGPVLDVVPYVSADGYTIQMVIIPTVTEFVGYDDPGQFIPQAQSVSGGAGGVGVPLTGQLPLPHFRLRQLTTSAVVWDGQTIVLGGLIAESVQKSKDKVPVLGDLPMFGRLFRSESSETQKRNLLIFVTPTIIDPAGNRKHSEEEMPFAQTTIPQQSSTVGVGN